MTDVPDPPDLHRLALSRIADALTAEEQQTCVVYFDATLHPAGAIQTGAHATQTDEPTCTLFIDGKPGANWMHPCRYLLLAPATGKLVNVPTDQPPAFGPLPASWSVLWSAPGIEAWRLLPLASTKSTSTP